MGKISPVSIKYNIVAHISLSSIAERPDVIGAVFGQTEGLLGTDLELRELQKAGKIGRIEVNLRSSKGKSEGEIIIPSSMGKSETAIVAAAVETIDRVGPCNAKIKVERVEDVRLSKREFIRDRAKELLKNLIDTMPDSQEFTKEVSDDVKAEDIISYGIDKLPAGPDIRDNEEIIIVEGRADVINLLKHGIKNSVALNGSGSNKTISKLIKEKTVTLFVDGDRGGDLVIKKMRELGDIDQVTQAPDGKEVEELTMKEIQKALRAKTSESKPTRRTETRPVRRTESRPTRRTYNRTESRPERRTYDRTRTSYQPRKFVPRNGEQLKQMAEEIVGTRGAFLLNKENEVLGRVPVAELVDTLKDMSESPQAIIMDGEVSIDLAGIADRKRIRYIVANASKAKDTRVNIINPKDL